MFNLDVDILKMYLPTVTLRPVDSGLSAVYYQIAQLVADTVTGDVHVRHVHTLAYSNFYRNDIGTVHKLTLQAG